MELLSRIEKKQIVSINRMNNYSVLDVFKKYVELKYLDFYKLGYCSMLDCVDSFLNFLGINISSDALKLKNIPKDEGFSIISNHKLHGLDALIIYSLIKKQRKDFYIVENVGAINAMFFKDIFFSPNVFKNNQNNKLVDGASNFFIDFINTSGLCFFPANFTVSRKYQMKVESYVWNYNMIAGIKKAKRIIIPIHLSVSKTFKQNLNKKLVEIFNNNVTNDELNKLETVFVTIGLPISVKDQNSFENVIDLTNFLRASTNMLGYEKIEVRKFFNKLNRKKDIQADKVSSAQDINLILHEIASLKDNEKLFGFKNFDVYCASAVRIPYVLHEIGRLRELAFRDVGEGTNKSLDMDEYDLYYEHLFIWDNFENKLVGAYRIGLGDEIIKQYGKKGFYIHSLFKIKDELLPVLAKSLELGRSFVAIEYQKKYLSLFLLWRGIICFLLKNEEYRYLIGPVSISNTFSELSKSLIVSSIKSHHFDHDIALYIKPRKPFKIPKGIIDDVNDLIKNVDMSKLDRHIEDIEKDLKLPVLLKKYISINAKIASFNVDPKFNNCLDGLMILDILTIPFESIKSISKEIGLSKIEDRFKRK